jgi:hypothetical protein
MSLAANVSGRQCLLLGPLASNAAVMVMQDLVVMEAPLPFSLKTL